MCLSFDFGCVCWLIGATVLFHVSKGISCFELRYYFLHAFTTSGVICGKPIMSTTNTMKLDVEKFIGKNDFSFWKIKMRALLIQHGLVDALKPETEWASSSNQEKKNEIF